VVRVAPHPRAEPPSAWDAFFSQTPDGWIRVRLKSGRWVGGAYAAGSYASGHPEPPDLLIGSAAKLRGDGTFELVDGMPELRDESLLVARDQIEYLEFEDA
jgi:uncharacterized protein DUF6338